LEGIRTGWGKYATRLRVFCTKHPLLPLLSYLEMTGLHWFTAENGEAPATAPAISSRLPPRQVDPNQGYHLHEPSTALPTHPNKKNF
jgi:hypothetical protein